VKPVRGCLVWCAWTGKFFALVNSQTYQLRIEHLEWSVSEWANGSSKWLDRELSAREPRTLIGDDAAPRP